MTAHRKAGNSSGHSAPVLVDGKQARQSQRDELNPYNVNLLPPSHVKASTWHPFQPVNFPWVKLPAAAFVELWHQGRSFTPSTALTLSYYGTYWRLNLQLDPGRD
jgi:hypothetical protein